VVSCHTANGKPDPSTPHVNGQADAHADPVPAFRKTPKIEGRGGWSPLMHWLADDGHLAEMSGSAAKVYLYLLRNAGDDGRVRGESRRGTGPTTEDVMASTGLSKNGVLQGVLQLEALGLLRVVRRTHASHDYYLTEPRGSKSEPLRGAQKVNPKGFRK
jgi:hypothetical protein